MERFAGFSRPLARADDEPPLTAFGVAATLVPDDDLAAAFEAGEHLLPLAEGRGDFKASPPACCCLGPR